MSTGILARLVSEAADNYQIHRSQVLEHGNFPRQVAARAYVAEHLRKRGHSLPAIGRLIGGFHHTTVMHLLRTAKLKRVDDTLVVYETPDWCEWF